MEIILVFPKPEAANNIKILLQRNGYSIRAVTSGVAQALREAQQYDSGIIVASYKLSDGMAVELYDELSDRYRFLIVGPKAYTDDRVRPDIFTLNPPMSSRDILETMGTIAMSYSRWRKKKRSMPRQRSEEETKTINRAKALLQDRNGLTEEEAHRYLQKTSMENGTGIIETANMILALNS